VASARVVPALGVLITQRSQVQILPPLRRNARPEAGLLIIQGPAPELCPQIVRRLCRHRADLDGPCWEDCVLSGRKRGVVRPGQWRARASPAGSPSRAPAVHTTVMSDVVARLVDAATTGTRGDRDQLKSLHVTRAGRFRTRRTRRRAVVQPDRSGSCAYRRGVWTRTPSPSEGAAVGSVMRATPVPALPGERRPPAVGRAEVRRLPSLYAQPSRESWAPATVRMT
jgi:hypothetical protein